MVALIQHTKKSALVKEKLVVASRFHLQWHTCQQPKTGVHTHVNVYCVCTVRMLME